MLWTRLMLADLSFGQDVPIAAGRDAWSTAPEGSSSTRRLGDGSRDNAARARRHDLFVAVADERAGGRAGEQRLCSSSKCRASRAKLQCKGTVLGMVGEVLGSASRPRETQWLERRGAEGAEALVVFQREPRRKRATHVKLSPTHMLVKTGNFWFCWRCGFHTVHRVKRPAGRCCGIVQSQGGVLWKLKGRWLEEPTWHAVDRAAATKVGWDYVVFELDSDGLSVEQLPIRHESHVSVVRARS